MCCFLGDRYEEEPSKREVSKSGGSQMEEIEDWDSGNRKSKAQEVLGKVREVWNRRRSFEEAPDYR